MNRERSNQGFGLAVFSIVLLALAFLTTFYFFNALVSSIIAILSAIMATAAYFEARRADGPRTFALTILMITIIGTFIILIWSGTRSRYPLDEEPPQVIMAPDETAPSTDTEQSKKLNQMEKTIEKLEGDTIK